MLSFDEKILEALQLTAYLELIPIGIIGLLCGAVALFNAEGKPEDKTLKKILKHVIYVSTLSMIIFMCLAATSLPYLARVGISAFIAFFGLDSSLDKIKAIFEMFKRKDS